jgi:hypothetical protein
MGPVLVSSHLVAVSPATGPSTSAEYSFARAYSKHPVYCRPALEVASERGIPVKKLTLLLITTVLALFSMSVAQDTTKSTPGTMKSDSMKAMSLTGKISDDGKTFTSDKDGKSWTIANPDAVKGHEGHHVMLKASVDAAKGEVEVKSLKMAKDTMKKDSM